MVDPYVRDLIILSVTTLVFVLTLYILSLRVARQRALEAQLDDAYDEIASLRASLADATRPQPSSPACACARSPSTGSEGCAWPLPDAPASPIRTGSLTGRVDRGATYGR